MRPFGRLAESQRAGDPEGHLGRVHFMIGAIDELHLDVHHGEAGQHTRLHGLQHAKEFKKLHQRETELEQAVTDAYKAMKSDGDLTRVDAALAKDANSLSDTNILA